MIRKHALTSLTPAADDCGMRKRGRNKLKRRTTKHVSTTRLYCERQKRSKPFSQATEAREQSGRSEQFYDRRSMDRKTRLIHRESFGAQQACSSGQPKFVSTLTSGRFCCARVAFVHDLPAPAQPTCSTEEDTKSKQKGTYVRRRRCSEGCTRASCFNMRIW